MSVSVSKLVKMGEEMFHRFNEEQQGLLRNNVMAKADTDT